MLFLPVAIAMLGVILGTIAAIVASWLVELIRDAVRGTSPTS